MVPEKQKILIADDSEMNRTLLVEMLKDNFEIAEVENGAQAHLRHYRKIPENFLYCFWIL